MRPPELFSKGASQAVSILAGINRGRGTAQFPGWFNEDTRINEGQSIAGWFKAVVGRESEANTRIHESAINDRLAMFGCVSWQDGDISFCRLHAVVVLDRTVFDLYSTDDMESPEVQYYRLDYDPKQPGPMFSEPLPHIHCWPGGAPRIPLPGNNDESLPVRFLEFIYLNHFHQDWTKWVKAEVTHRLSEGFPIEAIVEGFATGSILTRLGVFDPYLKELRTILKVAKRDYCRSRPLIPEVIQTLNYAAKD